MFREFSVLIAVIMVVVMMVFPMPTELLDILIILNISLSLTILLVSMNIKDSLHFSIFPSLLLITTLFRLALNVSTTRSILSKHDGGEVIHTFGDFVVGGEPIIGLVVFLILAIIQFIVITKGSERVAEVAARFTLDAMPGKQMSIDADLNAGLITEKEARERRRTIEREADFYGAMDGASKFVKGDAIAGIIILIINIIGGLLIGITVHGMDFSQAVNQYTILSVGDGLVAQIPALLISTATGIIVTRAASAGNLGEEIIGQLFAYPRLLYIAGGVILLMGILTPIPFFATLIIGGLLIYGGYFVNKQKIKEEQSVVEVSQEEQDKDFIKSPESVMNLLQIDPIEFEFGYGLIPLADYNQGGDLLDRVIMIRRQIALELGFVVPVVRFRDNIQLRPNEYVIKIKGNVVAKGEIMLDHYLAMSPGIDDEFVVGIETIEPAFGLPALWINDEMKERAELSGYTVVDPPSVVATHLTEVIKRHAHELLSRQDVKALVDNIKETQSALVDDLIPSVLSIGEIQKVLAKLLKEKISIRNLSVILETLADYGHVTKDPDVLTEYVRQALARQITHAFTQQGEPLRVITVGPGFEKAIADAVQHTEHGSYLALDPERTQAMYQALNEQINRVVNAGYNPILLSSPATRMYIRQFLDRVLPDVPILSFNELEPQVEIQSVGVVNV